MLRKEYGKRHCFHRGADQRPVFDAFEDEHGRLVCHRVFAFPEAASLKALRDWPGLRIVLVMETLRSHNGCRKVMAEIRYFLSLP